MTKRSILKKRLSQYHITQGKLERVMEEKKKQINKRVLTGAQIEVFINFLSQKLDLFVKDMEPLYSNIATPSKSKTGKHLVEWLRANNYVVTSVTEEWPSNGVKGKLGHILFVKELNLGKDSIEKHKIEIIGIEKPGKKISLHIFIY